MTQNKVITAEFTDNMPGSGPWRAVARLPDWLGKSGSSRIMGGGTKEGPWVDARGYTPREAVSALYSVIGRAVIRLKAEEMNAGPQPTEEP